MNVEEGAKDEPCDLKQGWMELRSGRTELYENLAFKNLLAT